MALFSIAVAAAIKIGYKLAEEQKWLPGPIYRQLALDKLKNGDIDGAARFNKVALAKNPDDDKAGLVQDIISMHRDAHAAAVSARITDEMDRIIALEKDRVSRRQRVKRLLQRDKIETAALWLLLGFTVSGWILVYWAFRHWDKPVAAALLGGLSVVMTILSGSFICSVPDRMQQRSLDRLELTAALQAMDKEIAWRKRQLSQFKKNLVDWK